MAKWPLPVPLPRVHTFIFTRRNHFSRNELNIIGEHLLDIAVDTDKACQDGNKATEHMASVLSKVDVFAPENHSCDICFR